MNSMLRTTLGAAAFGALALAPGMAVAADFSDSPEVTYRLSSSAPPGMEDSRAISDMVEVLSEKTGGTVTIEPYFSSSLFDEISGMEAAQGGVVDMAIACTCNMTQLTDAYLFSDLPYIWKEMDNGRAVWHGSIGKGIQDQLVETIGLRPVAYSPSGGGYRLVWNTRRPLKVPEDVAGLKLRTTATPVEQQFWKSMNASPTPVDVSEIYTALQQGLVDGLHIQPVWLQLLKHHEIVEYGTEIEALAVYRVLVINEDSYDRMDDAQKEAFAEAMKVFEDKAYQYNRDLRADAMEAIEAKGVEIYEPTDEELAKWREVGQSLWDDPVVTENIDRETIDKVLELQE